MPRVGHKADSSDSSRDERLQEPQPESRRSTGDGGSPTTEAALDVWLELLTDIITNAVIAEQRETDRP